VIDIAGKRVVSGDRRRQFLARLGNLVAQLNQAEQDFVALRLQFLDVRDPTSAWTLLMSFSCASRHQLPRAGCASVLE
jgi:hypothetical protein